MRYSVCVIDNDIPAAGAQAQTLGIKDSDLLNASNLQLLLQKEEWGDQVLKNLLEKLLTQTDSDGVSPKWEVYGFTNPSFYINVINDGFFRTDLLVFDWEYPGAQNTSGINPESILKEILDRTFCLVFIFSKADKKAEIEVILAKPEFQQYKERLKYLDKSTPEGEQTDALLQNAERMYAENFSFKFAGVLRRRSVQCADQILSDMGRASLNDVKNLLVVGHGGKKDFIDFLAERFRTSIAGPNLYDLVEQIPDSAAAPAIDATLASKVWSYRLYFQQETGDDLVRRGDIVSVGGEVLLVLSADCDLMRFWAKNLGIINAVALHELDQSNATLKAMLAICVKPDLAKPLIGSLLGKIGNLSEGPFILPFVPASGAELRNFVAIPKELVSKRVPTPTGWNELGKEARKSHPMKYAYWAGAQRLCTVSEPFLTPIIQHVFNTIGGAGVPDYPEHMKEILKKILEDFSAPPAAAFAPPAAAVTAPLALEAVEPPTPEPVANPEPQPAVAPASPQIAERPVPEATECPAAEAAREPQLDAASPAEGPAPTKPPEAAV
jgi:hypothetical protein